MGITSKDIARLAGVSRGTVDRALNNRGQISAEIKERILKIAADHGYVKNQLASNLAKNNRIPVAIVIPDSRFDIFWKAPFDGIKKAESFVKNYGMQLDYYLFDHSDSKDYIDKLESAILNKPKAILLAPLFLKESLHYLQIAQQNDISVICINSEIQNENILCYIGQNSFECGQLAGKLFKLSNNQRDEIVVITLGHNSKNASHIENKINGLRSFNKKNNLNYRISDFFINDFKNFKMLEDFAQKELINKKDKLRGIFFTNSRANNFINATDLTERLPKNVSIIGFDLIPQNVDLLLSDKIDFLLNQNPQMQGHLGIVNLFNHYIFKKELPPNRYLPIDIVLKENYEFYLKADEMNLDLVF